LEKTVSIVIVNWNSTERLRTCLRSLEKPIGRLDGEAIVIDNASKKDPTDILRREFPRVKVKVNKENVGYAAANNQGIRIASGKYVLLLNPDTAVADDALDVLFQYMEANPEVEMAAPKLLYPDGRLQRSIRSFPTFCAILHRHTILRYLIILNASRSEYRQRHFDYNKTQEALQPMGAALFFRRSCLERIGLLDERFFIFFEDVDICKRIIDAGGKIVYLPGAQIIHYGAASTGQVRDEMSIVYFESMRKYFEKTRGKALTGFFMLLFKPTAVFKISFEIPMDIARAAVYSVRGRRRKAHEQWEKAGGKAAFLRKRVRRFLTI